MSDNDSAASLKRLRAAVWRFIDQDDSPVWTLTADGGQVQYFCCACNRNEQTGEHEAECAVGELLAELGPAGREAAYDKPAECNSQDAP